MKDNGNAVQLYAGMEMQQVSYNLTLLTACCGGQAFAWLMGLIIQLIISYLMNNLIRPALFAALNAWKPSLKLLKFESQKNLILK